MKGHRYTEEEKEFMKSFVWGHSYAEIRKAFTEKFGWEITLVQIKTYIGSHHLNTGRTGRFVKGHESHNKGVKMPEEVYEKAKNTMFHKGQMPPNHRKVGSERVNADGYIEIKVEEPARWRLKHNVVWEYHNGKIPKGSVVIFLDGNRKNVAIENLMLVKRRELLIMNRNSLCTENAGVTEAGVNLARLMDSIHDKKKNK